MKPAFVLRWQTPTMPAPAFWYYAKRETAERHAAVFRPRVEWTIEQTEVTDDFELEDEGAGQ
jgi:hypothetical protein